MFYGSIKFCVFVFVHILVVEADRLRGEDLCTTPDGERSRCVDVSSCKFVLDLFDLQPSTPETTRLVRRYICGFNRQQPKVCCPSKPISLPSGVTTQAARVNAPPPNVAQHKNIGLLPENCGILDTNQRIVHGNKTGLFEFPWMALLSYKTGRGNVFQCGATIINNKYILTAAHCLTNRRGPLIGARVGEHNIDTSPDCEVTKEGIRICAPPFQDLAIQEIIPHPDYNTNKRHNNDIGLLRVSTMDLTRENVKAVCLPLENTRNYNFTNVNCVVTGWGVTENGRTSPDLLKVQIPVVPQEECVHTYINITEINQRQMCAGGKTGSDSCAGDSGGPLQVLGFLHEDTRVVQQGVVSIGPKMCGKLGLPTIYTRIAYYMDWILDNMKP